MEREKRITRVYITGIIQQVFDIYEKENELPNTYEFYKAIFNWIEYEKCPKMGDTISLSNPETNVLGGYCVFCNNCMEYANNEGQWKCFECYEKETNTSESRSL